MGENQQVMIFGSTSCLFAMNGIFFYMNFASGWDKCYKWSEFQVQSISWTCCLCSNVTLKRSFCIKSQFDVIQRWVSFEDEIKIKISFCHSLTIANRQPFFQFPEPTLAVSPLCPRISRGICPHWMFCPAGTQRRSELYVSVLGGYLGCHTNFWWLSLNDTSVSHVNRLFSSTS